MFGELLKWAAGAAVAYFAADTVSRIATNKGLHEHVFAWWNTFRDRITSWCNNNQHLGISRVIGRVTTVIDDVMVRTRQRIRFFATAETARQGALTVTEEYVPADEVAQLFPQLVNNTTVVIQ